MDPVSYIDLISLVDEFDGSRVFNLRPERRWSGGCFTSPVSRPTPKFYSCRTSLSFRLPSFVPRMGPVFHLCGFGRLSTGCLLACVRPRFQTIFWASSMCSIPPEQSGGPFQGFSRVSGTSFQFHGFPPSMADPAARPLTRRRGRPSAGTLGVPTTKDISCWLDLNAFGSVPHTFILGALRRAGVPEAPFSWCRLFTPAPPAPIRVESQDGQTRSPCERGQTGLSAPSYST
ncbi:hypothetical protein NPIL_275821 [Nephila pilipes]|uniref:Uncharacterized protein n=1 Tax=Nephila pilipes TaxID=299642 RepID=A0A8X6UFJ8_NEPPI|nr:hypothetical protein NPIL_275821 [Nephila pilipes]